jgi:hypothetical protein
LLPGTLIWQEFQIPPPTGITPANNVPLVVTVAVQQSKPVTMAVQ